MTEEEINNQLSEFFTLEDFIIKEQHLHPRSRGVFSTILRRIGLVAKLIDSKVKRAGLVDVLGKGRKVNVQGERQMKLDVLAHETMMSTLRTLPYVVGLASEEKEEAVILTKQPRDMQSYCILFDPLDGSSNIDANVSIGTIFSIHRIRSAERGCRLDDFLQLGNEQVAAGYVIYGSSTMFVYTAGEGVHGFTLDPEVGEFLLSHPDIRIPDRCKCFSANDANYDTWSEPAQEFADLVRYGDSERYRKTSSRYIGSLVSDFHRNLLYGGIFMYPENRNTGRGKLRLLYECAPLSFVAEKAGGGSTTGRQRMLDVKPEELHQRVPIVIGNLEEVKLYEKMVADHIAGKDEQKDQ